MKLSKLYGLWRAANRYISIVGEARLPEHLKEINKKDADDLYRFIKKIEENKTDFVNVVIERDVEYDRKSYRLRKVKSISRMVSEE